MRRVLWLTECRGCHSGGSWHNPAFRRLEQKDHEVEARLGDIVRPCFQKRAVEGERRRRKKIKVVLVTFLSLWQPLTEKLTW